MIIGIGHASGVGKDALAEILVRDHGFTRIAFADALRSVVYESCPDVRNIVDRLGWDVAKTTHPEVRQRLVDVGNACRRHIGPRCFTDAVARQIEMDRDYVISDVRYLNELAWVSGIGITVKLTRPGVEPLPDEADQALAKVTYWDFVIHNDGSLDNLADKARKLVSEAS